MSQTDNTAERANRVVDRRRVLSATGTALAAGLAGCSGLTGGGGGQSTDSGTDGGGSSGDVEIDYWMYFGAQENKEMTQLVEEFNSQDNGIHVNKQSVPFPEFLNKLFTAVNSGNAPHVASYYGSYGRHLEPITHPIDDYLSDGAKNEYFDIAWNNLQVDGSTYALPIDIHGKALYTNDDVLESAGVDPNFDDWDAFSSACDTIVSDTESRAFSFINWKVGQAAFRAYIIALEQAGGQVVTGEPGSYEVAYDDDVGMQTAEMMAKITGEYGWDTSQFQSDAARVQDFISGDLGMFIAGTWSVNNFENEDGNLPEDLSFSFEKPFMFPGDGEDVAWCESNSLYFPKNANHTDAEKQAAVEFAEYVTQNNTLWASAGGHLPAAKSVATSSEVKNTDLWQKYGTIQTMYEMVTNKQVRYQPQTSVHINSDRFWGPFLDMYLQNTDVQSGVTASADALSQALNQ
ncbi:extracellular solute-binding protein [Halogeometricum limi]|uniref:ABC-type glycerol-3-phosphate transport system, substrate-binding protein n=1 Tax=Halogeometricum limi TaxID=555875 RepID=A0A1I6ID44_9EURY|nr:extracellular solute-binding protein [Halogeometricum limi]SFR64544.1 ABC-type glycerol-3-phosphate transport system, substrate-binding protein [Halogeometricum limi]